MTKLRSAMFQGASKGALTVTGAHEIISGARKRIAAYANEHGVPLNDEPIATIGTVQVRRQDLEHPDVKVVVKAAEMAPLVTGMIQRVYAGRERNGSPILIDMSSSDS